MTEFEISLALIYTWIMGIVLGFIIWAPRTPFKQRFLDGMSLRVIWGRFIKK